MFWNFIRINRILFTITILMFLRLWFYIIYIFLRVNLLNIRLLDSQSRINHRNFFLLLWFYFRIFFFFFFFYYWTSLKAMSFRSLFNQFTSSFTLSFHLKVLTIPLFTISFLHLPFLISFLLLLCIKKG